MFSSQHEMVIWMLIIDIVCALLGLLIIVLLGFIENRRGCDTCEYNVPQPRVGNDH